MITRYRYPSTTVHNLLRFHGALDVIGVVLLLITSRLATDTAKELVYLVDISTLSLRND